MVHYCCAPECKEQSTVSLAIQHSKFTMQGQYCDAHSIPILKKALYSIDPEQEPRKLVTEQEFNIGGNTYTMNNVKFNTTVDRDEEPVSPRHITKEGEELIKNIINDRNRRYRKTYATRKT